MFFGSLSSAVWEPVRSWRASEHRLPAEMEGVLTVAGSLTRFLERHHGIVLEVELHDQFVDKASPDEAELLGCAPAARALRRQVSLLHRGAVMFDAESVLPLDTLPADLMQDLQEGEKPLGNLLLDRGLSLSRSDLSVTKITANDKHTEPLAKVVSGDLLPHSGAILSCNFGKWNHHSPHSNSKSHSKWDCNSSTQTFASGSTDAKYNNCWARQSVLRSGAGMRALVVEVFRPAMWRRIGVKFSRSRF